MSKDAGLLVLRRENAVLRRQISRVRYQRADGLWLSALSRLISWRRWGEYSSQCMEGLQVTGQILFSTGTGPTD